MQTFLSEVEGEQSYEERSFAEDEIQCRTGQCRQKGSV